VLPQLGEVDRDLFSRDDDDDDDDGLYIFIYKMSMFESLMFMMNQN
jgi:hypothetical protein